MLEVRTKFNEVFSKNIMLPGYPWYTPPVYAEKQPKRIST